MALAFQSSHPPNAGTDSVARWKEADNPEEEPIIPHTALFAALDSTEALKREKDFLPNVVDCAVHLEFLEATFMVLKQKILTSNALDRAFGLVPKDTLETVGRTKTRKEDPSFKKRQEVKWPIYVRLAAERFLLWWKSFSSYVTECAEEECAQLTLDSLPSHDVLMVWHALLLNPSQYKEFCEKNGCPERLQLVFPWKEIHISLTQTPPILGCTHFSIPDPSAIPKKYFAFDLSPKASALFTKHVGAPDLFEYLSNYSSHDDNTKTSLRSMIPTVGELPSPVASNIESASVSTLAGNVERQALFAQKMGVMLWIRSPAVEGTLRRANIRFERFMALFKAHPQSLLVPTLDIDLVWHTALCAPRTYPRLCMRLAGRVINHNDTLGEVKLKDGFKETTRHYESRFLEEYSACLCWNCEALRSELEKVGAGVDADVAGIAEKVREDVEYHKAVESARRSNKMLPVRVRDELD